MLIRLNALMERAALDISKIQESQTSHANSVETRLRGIEQVIDKKADKSEVEQLKQFRWWLVGWASGAVLVSSVSAFLVAHFFHPGS